MIGVVRYNKISKTSLLILLTGLSSIVLVFIFIIKIFEVWKFADNGRSDEKSVSAVITAANNTTPALYTEGNQIKRSDTGEKVILKGATSDAFRSSKGKYTNYDELFRRIRLLKEAGGNLITFWVTNEGYDARVDLAEKVVDFADDNGIYIMWGPAEFYSQFWDERRVELMNKLAIKFKDKTNVIYGLDAEPFQKWDVVVAKATKLGKLIRTVNPNALLLLPGGEGGKIIEQDGPIKFSLSNTIYGTEDYLANDLKDYDWLIHQTGYKEKYVWQKSAYSNFPILITEMGAVSSAGFSTPEDLDVITRMLNDIESRGFSYQMHSLDSYGTLKTKDNEYDNGGLGMFDKNDDLNEKGKLYFNFLAKHPGTKFK